MITDHSVAREPSGTWLFTWPAGISPYSIWLDGEELVASQTALFYEYEGTDFPDEAPPLEILEDGDVAENETFPPHAIVQWRSDQAAAAYEVQQKIDSVFIVVVAIMERGEGYLSWISPPLDDVTVHDFRVLALDAGGNEGPTVPSAITIVRNPPPPSVSVAVVAGDIKVSAA